MATTVMVDAARVRTLTTAHQVRTGYCAASRSRIKSFKALASASSRVKLWTTVTFPSTSPTRPVRSR